MRAVNVLGSLIVVCAVGAGFAGLVACTSEAEPAATAPSSNGEDAGTGRRRPTTSTDQPTVDPLDPDAGDCVGAPGELYALSAKALATGDAVPLCRFKGKVLLVVNVASQCGYTPQYTPLQSVFKTYEPEGFYVLGFPSKSFNQEYSDEEEISAFCTTQYKITFPMFALGNVNPPDEQPVYTWLKGQAGYGEAIPWNFEKFLLSRTGQIVARFPYTTPPNDPAIVAAIEAELAKP